MIKNILTAFFFTLSVLPSMGQINIIPRPAIIEKGSVVFNFLLKQLSVQREKVQVKLLKPL